MESTLDSTARPSPTATSGSRWAGRVLLGLPALFLTFDSVIKLLGHPAVAESSIQLGLPPDLAPRIGVVELACVVLLLIPRTALVGAVLLTGHLGGAVLAHARVGDPLLSHTLFPIYVGAMVWAGLYLLDDGLRGLLMRR
ncbi:MAG: DoxX family protein [Polyangiaceae bacterium]|nr:DoxX family protein [Polyangiaceae bacterium]